MKDFIIGFLPGTVASIIVITLLEITGVLPPL